MKKVDLDSVEHSMLSAGIDQKEVKQVIEDLKQQLEDEKALKDQQPRTKKIKYVVANTTDFKGDPTELPVTVVEAEESVQWDEIVPAIIDVAKYANNDCNKLKKDPVKSVFDAVERIPAKYFKEKKIKILSKEVVQVLETDNKLN